MARAQEKRTTEMQVIGAGKFNESSTQRERQNLLQQLISQKNEFKLDKVPNSEQFNKLIARGDEEFELFQKIDKIRKKHHEEYFKKKGFEDTPPVLLSEEELPEWLRNSEDTLAEDPNRVDEENSREKRKAQRNYFTDLTEDEFDQFLGGEITYESLRKGKDVHGKETVKRKHEMLENDIEEDSEKAIAQLDKNSESYQLTLAYLDGINQFLEEGPTPIEFQLVGVQKQKFTIKDVYNIFGYMAFSFAMAQKTDPLLTDIRDELGMDYLKDFGIDGSLAHTKLKSFKGKSEAYAEISKSVTSIFVIEFSIGSESKKQN